MCGGPLTYTLYIIVVIIFDFDCRVLFPGGATYFTEKNGYADAGKYIFTIARELNAKGEYFPLWGTCLGFELMPYLWVNRGEIRGNCESINQASKLHFVDGESL